MNFRSMAEQKKVESSIASIIMKGFQQATDLTSLANLLKIPLNPDFEKLVLIEDVPKSIKFKDITFRILGPTKKNFNKLRVEWRDWLNKKKLIQDVELQLLQILNISIRSLSSIMFLVKRNNNKILFTGGGLGKDVIDAL